MGWTKIMNKFRSRKNIDGQFTDSEADRKSQKVSETESEQMSLLKQTVQEFFDEMAVDLNFRILCETEPPTMLWIDNITVICCEPAQSEKDREEITERKPNKGSLWERIKNRLLGRKGKKKTDSP